MAPCQSPRRTSDRATRSSRARYAGHVVKKALIVAALALVVLAGLPVLMTGMGAMASCPYCDGATVGGHAGCPAVVLAVVLLVLGAVSRLRPRSHPFTGLLVATTIDRPPRRA